MMAPASLVAQLPQVDNIMRISFVRADWNTDRAKADHGVLIIRDSKTGRFAQAKLTETGPDTGTFVGRFYISWAPIKEIQPEIYDPPQSKALSKDGLVELTKLIETKGIPRKPFLITRDAGKVQTLEVYETKEMARIALELHKMEIALARDMERDPEPDDETEALRRELRDDLKLEREQLAQEQRYRQEQRSHVEAFRRLPLERRKGLILAAQDHATKALAAYQENRLPEADEGYREALRANPTAGEYKFQLGAVLFRAEKFKEALIPLRSASGSQFNHAERDYFVGLTLMKMGQRYNAVRTLHHLASQNVEGLSASAAFYEGLILMELKQYDRAKQAFQTVLDTSNDPQLDQSAEAYIEQIQQLQAFEAEKKKKYFLTGLLAGMYDSNVLTIADSSRSNVLATNTEGYRTLFSGNLEWRPIYEVHYEVGARANITGMYTVAADFRERATLRQADPTVLSAAGIYRRKGTLLGLPARAEFAPGIERITMAVEKDRDTAILDSYVGRMNNMLIPTERWVIMPNLELRQDTSLLASASGDNDSSALRYVVNITNMYLLGEDKSKNVSLDLGYQSNMAEGKSFTFQRRDVAGAFGHPGLLNTNWNWRAAYFQTYFSDLATPRTENNYTLSSTVLRSLTETLATSAVVSYTFNQSNDVTRQYNKLSILLSLIAQGVF